MNDQAVAAFSMKSARVRHLVLAGCLIAHSCLVAWGAWTDSLTVDESGHISAGLSHWETGNFTAYRVNPPLPRMLATLPVYLARPDLTFAALAYNQGPGLRTEFIMGSDFSRANREHLHTYTFLARGMGLLWSLSGAAVLYFWARSAAAPWAGVAAVAVWCFEPNIIAHAHLVTPDLPAAVAGFLAMFTLSRHWRRPSLTGAWVSGLALGLALCTKFTLIVLCPIYLLTACMITYSAIRRDQRGWANGWWFLGLQVILALLLVNVMYGFERTFKPLGEMQFVSKLFSGVLTLKAAPTGESDWGNRFRGTWLESIPVPVPEDYLTGIDIQRMDLEDLGNQRPSYLNGIWASEGCWYYYLVAILVKVPLGFLFLIVAGFVAVMFRWLRAANQESADKLLFAVLPLVVILGTVSSHTGFNHHMRYVLPCWPLGILLVGEVWKELRGVKVILAAGLLGWGIASSILAQPHSLAYFNELAGGPNQGHRYLLNSNLDWGQDLLRLKHWLNQNALPDEPVYLAYFGFLEPELLGIEFGLPPYKGMDRSNPANDQGPQPGLHVISVNFVQGMQFSVSVNTYHRISVPLGGYSHYQRFTPIAKAGYSLWIYRLGREEANQARRILGYTELPLE